MTRTFPPGSTMNVDPMNHVQCILAFEIIHLAKESYFTDQELLRITRMVSGDTEMQNLAREIIEYKNKNMSYTITSSGKSPSQEFVEQEVKRKRNSVDLHRKLQVSIRAMNLLRDGKILFSKFLRIKEMIYADNEMEALAETIIKHIEDGIPGS